VDCCYERFGVVVSYCVTEYIDKETVGDQEFWDVRFDTIGEAEIVAEHIYKNSLYHGERDYYVMVEEYDEISDEFFEIAIFTCDGWYYDEDMVNFFMEF